MREISLGDTIDFKFCTVSTVGLPTALIGSPVVSAYLGNNTTELTAGITLSVDFDGRTGFHNVRVVASSGNGFAVNTEYTLVVTAGTVGGTSIVGYVVGEFVIERAGGVLAMLKDIIGGSGAGTRTMSLKQLSLVNTTGDALVATSSGSNGNGINASGNGSGAGLKITGGATGSGVKALGGATSGHGVDTQGQTQGCGVYAAGRGAEPNFGHGISATAEGTDGSGLYVKAKGNGDGITAFGPNDAAGSGIWCGASSGSNGHGFQADGEGSGGGVFVQGGANGNGVDINGGATDAYGLVVQSVGGNKEGVLVLGHGSGAGIQVVGGATGNGINAVGGATSGSGITSRAQADGNGIYTAGAGASSTTGEPGAGIAAVGVQAGCNGILAVAWDNGDGVQIYGQGTGKVGLRLYDGTLGEVEGNINGSGIVKGVVTTGASTTSIPTSSIDPAPGVTDQFKYGILIFDKATATVNLRGQRREVTGSGTNGTITVSPALTTAPASGDQFRIY